jgi:hypothetical protein
MASAQVGAQDAPRTPWDIAVTRTMPRVEHRSSACPCLAPSLALTGDSTRLPEFLRTTETRVSYLSCAETPNQFADSFDVV